MSNKELACQQFCGISLPSLVEPYLILPYYAIVKGDTKPEKTDSGFLSWSLRCLKNTTLGS
ncbi:hypothetical protein E2C01_052130 [Portunus trituberculatus]|uniref:Uncharacterized protein n=1 Tax=Portunus trituberculatus TaxID=210409 RepID=A0A5B7GL33_PORTR|nr:hypothetical protein [Portunus trituberculatus]